MYDIKTQLLELREQLVCEMRQELLGPGSECLYSGMDIEQEIITDLPETRYSVGVLYPQENALNVDNSETLSPDNISVDLYEIESEDIFDNIIDTSPSITVPDSVSDDSLSPELDEVVGLSSQNKPSSMGFTFFVRGNADVIDFDINFGTYRGSLLDDCVVPYNDQIGQADLVSNYVTYADNLLKLKVPIDRKAIYNINNQDQVTDKSLINALYKLAAQCGRQGYVREPHQLSVRVAFAEGDYNDRNDKLDGRELKLVVLRRRFKDDIYAITAMLVNTNKKHYNGLNSVFQPVISVSSTNNRFIFERYDGMDISESKDEEEKSLTLLYRNKMVFATGHGVSVDWNIDKNNSGVINTEFLPIATVKQMDFSLDSENISPQSLSMQYLSDLNLDSVDLKCGFMKELIEAYEKWINKIFLEAAELDINLKPKALEHIKDCRETVNRMCYGLELLKANGSVFIAFQLANRAMYMQRIHGDMQQIDSYPNDNELQDLLSNLNYVKTGDIYYWRPFQLAFLLMNLRSIIEPDSKERDLVDLIWFPTGGGKTEAYLGLTAFTIFYRKLVYPLNAGGTTVIMRYTLRLLAAQQFSRAAILICACEAIRKDCRKKNSKYTKYPLGEEEITIGLWIGGDHTPNKNEGSLEHKGAREYLEELISADENNIKYAKDKNNKFQVLKCPWCGTKLVKDLDDKGQLMGDWGYKLKDNKHFYLACPQEGCKFNTKLPIQIVDEELYSKPPTLLFGTVDKFAMLAWKPEASNFFSNGDNNRCPELIIQDELHLISGPLGTIVGIYEAAIDALCSHKGIRPKIIASTATIRRAKDQCRNLYNRDVTQFPAPGIDADDSFFAREADIDKKPGRLYFGIMPSGKTKAMMEVRTIAAILQRINLMDYSYEVKDKFWTLSSYFNSLRDLGGCATRVDDDIKDYIRRISLRLGNSKNTRGIGSAYELTSRISTTQLNETLDRLERVKYTEENQTNKKYPISVLLATNMISVGVDVDRLNIMVIIGQPKLTSEYIQASSRIGRKYPGIAFTIYDASKSRDRSHYEQFKSYHESFYRYVEPTSVTPYSKPARERALHAIQIILMRNIYGLPRDNDARYFDVNADYTQEINQFILKRIDGIRQNSMFVLSDENIVIESELNKFWAEWGDRLERAAYIEPPSLDKDFCYGEKYMIKNPQEEAKRLIKVYGSSTIDNARETLTSMRNVDKNVATRILIWSDNIE